MSIMTGFLAGVAGLVNAAGVGVYDPQRVWTITDTDIGVAVGHLQEAPSQQIAVTGYTVQDDPRLTDSRVGTQFRIRGTADPASVYAVNDALFDLLHGLHDVTVSGVPVALVWRQNSLPGGQDANRRYEHTASFYWQVAWPGAHRLD